MQHRNLRYANPLKKKLRPGLVADLPEAPGIFRFVGDPRGAQTCLFVGAAPNLRKAVSAYCAAKPGQASDTTLELLELAAGIDWEACPSFEAAAARQAILVGHHRPPFNERKGETGAENAGLALGLRTAIARDGSTRADFRVSHARLAGDFDFVTEYPRRGKARAGYAAVLRLLHAVTTAKPEGRVPDRLRQARPPLRYDLAIPSGWGGALEEFLAGASAGLLRLITLALLEKDLPEPARHWLQADIDIAREFYRECARGT